ncbi:MAG: hypothetical protein M1819_005446 [Sarea resinae]|nr:MAG: hypothetical protein M1819_005446 [Sarea resinae]
MDALQSFSYLTDNVPTWLSNLDSLAQRINSQQDEIQRLTEENNAEFNPRKPKSPSMESLGKEHAISPAEGRSNINTGSEQRGRIETPFSAIRREQEQQRRKRKPGSSASRQSGRTKFRTGRMIVVNYDSGVQNAFESLVRDIATARNNLRKGKMAEKMKQMAAMIDTETDIFGGLGDDEDGYKPKLNFRRMPRARGLGAMGGGDAGTNTIFDAVDGRLDKAQKLCEVGAHQVLRDGNCELELDGTKDNFEEVLRLAQKEVGRLAEENRREEEKAMRIQEERQDKKFTLSIPDDAVNTVSSVC